MSDAASLEVVTALRKHLDAQWRALLDASDTLTRQMIAERDTARAELRVAKGYVDELEARVDALERTARDLAAKLVEEHAQLMERTPGLLQ